MQFLKNHYEKIILGIVLLVLAGVAAWLPMKISADKAQLEDDLRVSRVEPEEVDYTDLSPMEFVRRQVSNPPQADFAGNHNTFNPVVWVETSDGELVKRRPEDVGVNKLEIKEVTPLVFSVEYDRPSTSGYYFYVTREDAVRPSDRRRRGVYVSAASEQGNDILKLKEVRGEVADPLAFVLEVVDSGADIVVSKSRPYVSTNGYSATIEYPPSEMTWKDVRIKTPLVFAGDTNIIVDINPDEVILRAVSNEKPTTVPVN